MALHRHLYALGAMPIDTISYAIVALLRLIILSLWLIRLLALQLSLTLASFCAPDESRRTKRVITVTIFRALRCVHPRCFFRFLEFHLNSRLMSVIVASIVA